MSANGFLVVRLPDYNVLSSMNDQVLPALGTARYSGIDRNAWVDVYDDDFYDKQVPTDIVALVERLDDAVLPGWSLCKSIADAKRLLAYSNRAQHSNELLYVTMGKASAHEPPELRWLGYDVVAEGEWSLLAAGLFGAPEAFSNWAGLVNAFGLFDTPDPVSAFIREYDLKAHRGLAEPTASEESGLKRVAVRVGRLPN